MKKQTMIRVLGILVLCLLTTIALADHPVRKPTAPSPSRVNAREPGALSRAHISSPQSRTSRPSVDTKNWRSPMPVSATKPAPVKSANSRFNPPARIEKSTVTSRISREDRDHSRNDHSRPESRERPSNRDDYRRDRDGDRDHDRRPPQRDYSHYSHRSHYDPWRYRYQPYYRHRDYRRPSYGFSISLGSNWDLTSYDSFYSNYYDSGLSWGLSYGSDDYSIYVSSGSPSYASAYQVWVPGHWETVTDRVTEVGFGGVVSWRYRNHQVWKPGYWKVCYR